MLELPANLVIDRVGEFGRRQGSCLRGIGRCSEGVCSHVGHTRGLRGGTRGRHCSGGDRIAGGAAGDETPTNLFSRTELPARESSRSSDRISRAVILRSVCFEQAQDSIGAVRRPRRDNATIGFAQGL
jgi:hypothetical protein